MPHSMPPLNALKAFEAVARLGSFTLAADELFVTRAAISHQVKHLEQLLGFALLIRKNKGLELTPASRIALPQLQKGFAALNEGVKLLHNEQGRERLNVWAAPSFASKWLVPRLADFAQKHPEIELRISGDNSMIERTRDNSTNMDLLFQQQDTDVIIRYSSGAVSGCLVDKLFAVEAVAVCHPDLISPQHEHPLLTPNDIEHHTLLHDDTPYQGKPSWADWLALHHKKDVSASRGMYFNQIAMALEAAMDKQGVLVTIRSLVNHDVAAGRLVIPFNLSAPLSNAYYVIRPSQTEKKSRSVELFVDWLQEKAKDEVLG